MPAGWIIHGTLEVFHDQPGNMVRIPRTVADNGNFVSQTCVLEKHKNRFICFDHFSPVVFLLIV
jgi:hypothetical protein